jgi:hypothetical protein
VLAPTREISLLMHARSAFSNAIIATLDVTVDPRWRRHGTSGSRHR